MANNEPGYVYILTNPSFREDWVKIGKSSRPVDVRSKELDNTAVPLPFEIFATMKMVKYNEVEKLVLRKRKLIEGSLPHIYVAKNIVQVTGQKVEYSKHKGLADKKCEALLLESLNDHKTLSKQEIVRLLWDLLPDQLEDKQKINKIDYILKRLRMAGKIYNETKGSDSVWSLGKP